MPGRPKKKGKNEFHHHRRERSELSVYKVKQGDIFLWVIVYFWNLQRSLIQIEWKFPLASLTNIPFHPFFLHPHRDSPSSSTQLIRHVPFLKGTNKKICCTQREINNFGSESIICRHNLSGIC